MSQRLRSIGLLKAHDLITSPAYIVIKAAEEFKDKTTAPNQLWQTDFTYLKIMGWGWYYLSTVLDDFSRFIVAWKLCATMKAQDVTATLDLALAASGLDQMTVVHRPRLLSDNDSSYVATDLAQWLDRQEIEHVRGAPYHPQTQGGGANPTNSGLFRRVRTCWKRRIACKLPHEEHQFSAIISETRFSHWRRPHASMITRRGRGGWNVPTAAGTMTREIALLLFNSVRADVSTIDRISFACTQGRIERE